jgi:hypothetical protein
MCNRTAGGWFRLAALSLLLCVSAFGETEFQLLKALVDESFRAQVEGRNPQIVEINQRGLAVDRSVTSGAELNRLKFMLTHWRQATRDILLEQATQTSSDYARTCSGLNQLGAILEKEHIAALVGLQKRYAAAVSNEDFEHLLVSHGDAVEVNKVLPASSPRRAWLAAAQVKLGPIDPNFWFHASGWLDVAGVDNYIWDGECVLVRGIRVCAGDTLLVDLAKIFDGINTSFSLPRSNFTTTA